MVITALATTAVGSFKVIGPKLIVHTANELASGRTSIVYDILSKPVKVSVAVLLVTKAPPFKLYS